MVIALYKGAFDVFKKNEYFSKKKNEFLCNYVYLLINWFIDIAVICEMKLYDENNLIIELFETKKTMKLKF